ncbi:hypothetical protein KP509_36G006300 [Ceratopteris richardii]|uniref:Uncharacterized protein n=1 Tax=Ceratopteris richardii TaxID=49495 RepID=A0A8T2Q9F9_CERRI|nr:hypothetical protein KP509_36G006300 [Ceratopteris richardii]
MNSTEIQTVRWNRLTPAVFFRFLANSTSRNP